ncbi:protein asteroid-like isoform X1 [Nomia melanderi]|uniref:protein asteroid-like isoform X1 n=1 Tax=Nomia melanderi TaxID=2448451 RepID=UPI003FCDF876
MPDRCQYGYSGGCKGVKHEVFINFLSQFKKYLRGKAIYNIRLIFDWLSKHTLEEAIIKIMSGIPKPMREKVLHVIEANINYYTCLPAVDEYIKLLGVSKDSVECTIDSTNEIYKFEGDIQSLPYKGIESFNGINEQESSIDQLRHTLIEHEQANRGPSNESMIDTLPEWFLNDFYMARLPGMFLSLIGKHWYPTPIQIDNFQSPSSYLIGFDILKVTFGILSSATDEKRSLLKCMVRNQRGGLEHHDLEGTKTVPLSEVRELPLNHRKEILDNTLGILDIQCIETLPPEWKLYIACFKYWTDRAPQCRSDKCYRYSIIFSMLFNIIITKIGQHKSLKSLESLYPTLLSDEMKNFIPFHFPSHFSSKETNSQAYIKHIHKEINMLDCLLAVPFFIKHAKLQSSSLKTRILHSFVEFQICLSLGIDLNALLDCPYEEVNVATFINGLFLYNLYVDFKERNDVHDYASGILTNSSTLLKIFNELVTILKYILQ